MAAETREQQGSQPLRMTRYLKGQDWTVLAGDVGFSWGGRISNDVEHQEFTFVRAQHELIGDRGGSLKGLAQRL